MQFFSEIQRQDLCQTEKFEASCPSDDEVLIVRSAMYGRMKIGRCVQTDYGHVGCKQDVLRQTDRRCSGRQTCQVEVPNADFDSTKPCPNEFKTYFEVAYECVKGKNALCNNRHTHRERERERERDGIFPKFSLSL